MVLDLRPPITTSYWTPPQTARFKANFDGAVFMDSQMAGIGVVIKDSGGHVTGTLSERLFLPSTVDDMEAVACKKAISFALNLGLDNVVFEGDSETVIKALNSNVRCLTSFGHLIDDAKALVLNFANSSFSHVKQTGNTIADKLAKLAKQFQCPQIWYDDIPGDVQHLVLADRRLS